MVGNCRQLQRGAIERRLNYAERADKLAINVSIASPNVKAGRGQQSITIENGIGGKLSVTHNRISVKKYCGVSIPVCGYLSGRCRPAS